MRTAVFVLTIGVAACGDNLPAPNSDAAAATDAPVDGRELDAFGPLVRVFGNVQAYGQPAFAARATLLANPPQETQTDIEGNFYFDVPEGSAWIVKVDNAGAGGSLPMIRGVIAQDHLRVRNFYIVTNEEVAAAQQLLGITFDPSKAIVEVDFRNASTGGYSATLTPAGGSPLVPGFGIVYDAQGQPQLGDTTLTGGDGSTLLLGGLPPQPVSFTPTVPAMATLPCTPRDAQPLPLQAGVVTWFDFECGMGED